MDVQGRLSKREGVFFFLAVLTAEFLAFPSSARAIQVGCFCTFVFVSTMFMIGIGLTLVGKNLLSQKIWKLSWRRTSLITFFEVTLLVAVLVVLQTQYYLRVLAYLPLAFLLNYTLTTERDPAPPREQTPKKRAAMAALSCLVLPIAVQIMAWLATVLSNMITFKEVRV